jgi:hypothetical protein
MGTRTSWASQAYSHEILQLLESQRAASGENQLQSEDYQRRDMQLIMPPWPVFRSRSGCVNIEASAEHRCEVSPCRTQQWNLHARQSLLEIPALVQAGGACGQRAAAKKFLRISALKSPSPAVQRP